MTMETKILDKHRMARELFIDILHDAGRSLDDEDLSGVIRAAETNSLFLVNLDYLDYGDIKCACPLVSSGIRRDEFDGTHEAFMEVYDEQVGKYLELDDQPALVELR